MGALFTGIIRAPMTSVVMIFEMTRDYAVIVPLMISNLISLFITSRLQPTPIYEALAEQDGIHLPTAASRNRSSDRQVARIMRSAAQSLAAETTVREALAEFRTSKFNTWLITDASGIIGVVNLTSLEKANAISPDQTLRDLIDPMTFPHVHSDHSLDTALDRMGKVHLDLLPVVNRGNIHKLEGVVTPARRPRCLRNHHPEQSLATRETIVIANRCSRTEYAFRQQCPVCS
jgi:CIC family chloride channel protein